MNLLSPLPFGNNVARNRIVFGPHETNLGSGRELSLRHVAYYRRRATGGAGTIIIEEASVHPSDWPYERSPLASRCGIGWAKIANALHVEGALAFAALGHSGGQGSSLYTQAPMFAPSTVPEVVSREVPKSMELEDIAAVVTGFGDAARMAIEAGLDGVEINAGQFSLVRQFLSTLTNYRADEYGTDRTRFAREVLAAVRQSVGSAVVGLRLSCDEMIAWGGISPAQATEYAQAFAEYLDYIVVVRGSIYSTWATRPDMHTEPGFNLELARSLRGTLSPSVTVIAQGSIVDVEIAEKAIVEGVCDGIEMTRAQIADPQLVTKVSKGQADRIRPCILCNQNCSVRDVRNPIVSCAGEPSSGHETEDAPVDGKAARVRDVLVVGGGPSGLECARVAALRGHRVRLAERSERLGGSLRIAAGAPGRARLAKLADWLEAECRALGVQMETSREISVEELGVGVDTRRNPLPFERERTFLARETAEPIRLAAGNTSTILCTGSRSGYRDYAIDQGAFVTDAYAVLEAKAANGLDSLLPNGPIAIWDPIGGPIAISVAELLASQRTVVLITPDQMIGKELSRSGDLTQANIRLYGANVRMVKCALLRRAGVGMIEIEDRFSGKRERIEAVALIDAGHRLPEDSVWQATGKSLVRAGDAVAPRSVHEAILEGRRAALSIGEAQ
jgi:2,4-dienoyl-CoA reductase (NADPH2)